jgi:alanine racemase
LNTLDFKNIITCFSSNCTLKNIEFDYISIDSRTLILAEKTLFFAFDGSRKKGYQFIPELIEKGVRFFVIDEKYHAETKNLNASFFYVSNVLEALQNLAKHKRALFKSPVIGITGSNGKTIVKEWLFQLLKDDFQIVKSPKSFNSQIGVPLSLWNLSSEYNLALIEVGISKKGEMERQEKMVSPEIGILTSFGNAHNEGFNNKLEKLREKLSLFKHSKKLIYSINDDFLFENVPAIMKELESSAELICWGNKKEAKIQIFNNFYELVVCYNNDEKKLIIPFSDSASIENISSCIALFITISCDFNPLEKRVQTLQKLEMRLEEIDGFQNNKIINDSYTSDIDSLQVALQFLGQQGQNRSKVLILSEIYENDFLQNTIYEKIARLLEATELEEIVFVGEKYFENQPFFENIDSKKRYFADTKSFITEYPHGQLKNSIIMLKGARKFEFEKILHFYQEQTHETSLEINLSAIKKNLNVFASQLKPSTKIMIMLKAFGYGLGSRELAKVLEYQKADYFAVAYIDEGIELRNQGVKTPIMVMNCEWSASNKLIEYDLEPEIYSIDALDKFLHYSSFFSSSNEKKLSIHLKIDTGMNRLGFKEIDIDVLINTLTKNKHLHVQSVMSHLSASDEKELDYFTHQQASLFEKICNKIEKELSYTFIKHLLNTEGIVRFPQYQYDMVRLGIGLFGIEASHSLEKDLSFPVLLKSKVAQVKPVTKNEFVGYSLKGKIKEDSEIAIINIGYADGFYRKYGNGNTFLKINDCLYPTIGNICMDMCMVLLDKNHAVKPGDLVEIIYDLDSISKLSLAAETIPYEILTSISQRVKRTYYEE